jgi:hypothetical protein
MNMMRSYCVAITALSIWVTGAAAQLPHRPSPSTSLVLPPFHQVPVSPAPGIGGPLLHHYHSVCSVFRHKPCLPYYLPPIGQDLRLTIVSTDQNASQSETMPLSTAPHPSSSMVSTNQRCSSSNRKFGKRLNASLMRWSNQPSPAAKSTNTKTGTRGPDNALAAFPMSNSIA